MTKPVQVYEATQEEKRAVRSYALKHAGIRHRELAWRMVDEEVAFLSPSTVYRILKGAGTQSDHPSQLPDSNGTFSAGRNERALGKPEHERWDSTTSRIKDAGEPLVEYLLFRDEARLTGHITGTSPFAKKFQARGPFDSHGCSLRQLNLKGRMFRYPLSYLIYSESFCDLPGEVRNYVWQRLWDILNGRVDDQKLPHLTEADRQAILEIVRETHPEMPDFWNKGGGLAVQQ